MPLGTLDRTPPPFFKQGPSALSKLLVASSLAILLMVADLRFEIAKPIRVAVATVLYPLQWLVMQPLNAYNQVDRFIQGAKAFAAQNQQTAKRLAEQSAKAAQVDQLLLENQRLRQLQALPERLQVKMRLAQVLYEAADPYSRKVVIDLGQLQGVQNGSPVMDEWGILGQVTRVYPSVSEVSLLVDRDQSIPVLNVRSGLRAVAFGRGELGDGGVDLRYVSPHADIQAGDLLVTSGVDGVYPPGQPVAKVKTINRTADSAFALIEAQPVARVAAAYHVAVLDPVQLASPRPEVQEHKSPAKRRGRP